MTSPIEVTDIQLGLPESEARTRLLESGPNELPSAKPKGTIAIAAEVLHEPMFLLLLATGAIYVILGDLEEAIGLLAAIFVVIGITMYQQRRTEKTLQALRDLSSPRALVIRDGRKQRIAGRDVVRGDLLVLSEGDRVAADAMILSSINLSIDESLLTGESLPVRKSVWDGCSPMGRPGGDDTPAVFSGTMVVRGTGVAAVQQIGLDTEVGKLGRALQGIEIERTHLELETRWIVRLLGIIGACLCTIIALGYGLMRNDWLQGALAGLALAISLAPEEFPVVLTVFLALGAWRISKKRVLTRRVAAIETLGAATVLCVDKTGTLTMNRMTVREVQPYDNRDDLEVLHAASMASGADPVDPMEQALHSAAHPNGASGLTMRFVREYPLSSELLAMSRVVHIENRDEYDVFCKGAPEAIAQLCRLSKEDVLPQVQSMAARGLRILGVAQARISLGELPESQRDFNFMFLGLIGLEDPVRPSVPAAIRECREAGIRVVMITGDYSVTARSIARAIGLTNPDDSLTGAELQMFSDEELAERVRDVNIFARVLPEQKLRLVEALKANQEVVAMTGDGVNDAPALKAAHIGIAMGGRGTDVAREAASLVLLDDDFSSIVASIRIGRRIYDNLKKAMTYIIAIHVPIAGISVLPVLFGLPLVLMPLHIVFLELVIDPACCLAFESEPEHPRIMRRRPRDPKARLFDKQALFFGIFQGFSLLAVTTAALLFSMHNGYSDEQTRTVSFATLALGNIALIWANRSRTRIIPAMMRAANPALWTITAGSTGLLALVIYVEPFRGLFQFSAIHPIDIIVSIALAMVGVTWVEVRKLLDVQHGRLP